MRFPTYYQGYKRHGMTPQQAYREAQERVARDEERMAEQERKGYGYHAGKGPEAARFSSIREIEEANKRIGNYWFSPDTKRFFKSRVHPRVYGGHFFVSSEQPPYGPREYAVRKVDRTGRIHTVAKGFSSARQAQSAITRIMKHTKVKRSR